MSRHPLSQGGFTIAPTQTGMSLRNNFILQVKIWKSNTNDNTSNKKEQDTSGHYDGVFLIKKYDEKVQTICWTNQWLVLNLKLKFI